MTFRNILQSKRRLKLTESHLEYLQHGKARAISKAFELQVTSGCIAEQILNLHSVLIQLQFQNRNVTSVTVESLPRNNQMISNDNQTILDHSILNILLLRMLAQELIGLEKGCKPFWNAQSARNSEKLWLPTEIDLPDLGSNSSSPSSKKAVAKSSFSITRHSNPEKTNLPRTSLLSSMSSTPVKWEEGDTVTRCLKLKLYPNCEQKRAFKRWFGTYRFVYNRALAYSNEPKSSIDLATLFNPSHRLDFYTMRDIFVTQKDSENTLNDWEFETPKDIRAGAIKELTTALSTNIQKVVSGKIARFKMQFKSKKRKISEISVSLKALLKSLKTINCLFIHRILRHQSSWEKENLSLIILILRWILV